MYLFVLSVLIMYLCILFICIYLRIHGLFTFFGKKGILLAHTPETDAIFNHFQQKYFFKTQGNRLGAIVAPNKRL